MPEEPTAVPNGHRGPHFTSLEAVVMTLLEAVVLVVIVVVLFLQTWRASIIPLLSVIECRRSSPDVSWSASSSSPVSDARS